MAFSHFRMCPVCSTARAARSWCHQTTLSRCARAWQTCTRATHLTRPHRGAQACSLWEAQRVGLRLRRFDSGVLVVQSQAHSDDQERLARQPRCMAPAMLTSASLTMQMAASLERLAEQSADGVCAADASRALGLPPAVAREYLLAAEARGVLCRDDAPDGLRFFRNPWRAV